MSKAVCCNLQQAPGAVPKASAETTRDKRQLLLLMAQSRTVSALKRGKATAEMGLVLQVTGDVFLPGGRPHLRPRRAGQQHAISPNPPSQPSSNALAHHPAHCHLWLVFATLLVAACGAPEPLQRPAPPAPDPSPTPSPDPSADPSPGQHEPLVSLALGDAVGDASIEVVRLTDGRVAIVWSDADALLVRVVDPATPLEPGPPMRLDNLKVGPRWAAAPDDDGGLLVLGVTDNGDAMLARGHIDPLKRYGPQPVEPEPVEALDGDEDVFPEPAGAWTSIPEVMVLPTDDGPRVLLDQFLEPVCIHADDCIDPSAVFEPFRCGGQWLWGGYYYDAVTVGPTTGPPYMGEGDQTEIDVPMWVECHDGQVLISYPELWHNENRIVLEQARFSGPGLLSVEIFEAPFQVVTTADATFLLFGTEGSVTYVRLAHTEPLTPVTPERVEPLFDGQTRGFECVAAGSGVVCATLKVDADGLVPMLIALQPTPAEPMDSNAPLF